MKESIMDIENKHPLYEANESRWNYLLASYLGGKEYRSPSLKMLRKYLDEENATNRAYEKRLEYTPLDNLVKLTTDTYRSFLWRSTPIRTFGNQATNPLIQTFIEDVDFEGNDLDDFMKEANNYAMVYGHVWIMVTKGFVNGVISLAQEIEVGLRPYVKIFTPENVINWKTEKLSTGKEILVELTTQESVSPEKKRIIVWSLDTIITYEVETDDNKETITMTELQINPIGVIPFVLLKANNTQFPYIGKSDIEDVAKTQQAIFNLLSEAEQGIRISNHPTLAKTADTYATAGAGSVIDLDPNLDPNLKPYLLEPSGTNISSIISMLEVHIDSALRATHLGAIMAGRGLTPKSGIALATEFEQLNVRLGDKAAKLEAAELKIWELFWLWSGMIVPTEFNVEYHKTFDLRDEAADLALYGAALELPIKSVTYQRELQKQIAKLVIKNGDAIDDIMAELDAETFDTTTVQGGPTNAATQGLQ